MMTEYRVGTASWTDPTLLAATFYPSTARTPEKRLRFYAAHFDTVEVDSTYYALPSERNAALWAMRTPDDFVFNVKAFALLTQHAAELRALPVAIKQLLAKDALRQPRLQHPSGEVLDASFAMFRSALAPLRAAGKLGCIVFTFPPWFVATGEHEAYLDVCQARLPEDRLAIEFRHASWFGARADRTVELLAERGMSLVCVDAPQAASIARPPWVVTGRVAYVRLHGRNRDAWFGHAGTAAQRFKYLYSERELRDCAAHVRRLDGAQVTHVVFNNCYADYGVRNAAVMRELLGPAPI